MPLDPVLTSPSAKRVSGGGYGIRIGHTITSRVLLLASYDQINANLVLTDDAVAAMTAASNSFKAYFDSLLPRPCCTNVSTSSTLSIGQGSVTEKVVTLAAEIRIATVHGWTPFLAVGGGLALPFGDGPTVTLLGHYQFNFVNPGVNNDGLLLSETDQVRFRYQVEPTPIGVFGLGVERDLGRHIGFRLEGRSLIGANSFRIRLDTQPVSAFTPPGAVTVRASNPALQISANPNFPTSLSFQGIDRFDSFIGRGDLPTFNAAIFLRF